jgi:diaminopimelate epimerase
MTTPIHRMELPIAFTKASGAGNDFVLINNFSGSLDVDFPQLARVVCDRHFGVGADGLLVLEKSSRADYSMLYYNADGSWGGMCGNGGRCIARFALREKVAGSHQKFEALDFLYEATVGPELVILHMKDPVAFRPEFPIDVGDAVIPAFFLDTGAPHVVTFVVDLVVRDVERVGREIRHHAMFRPEGTNVNFAALRPDNIVELRTYERGVEAETLACGTGSVASALVAAHRFSLTTPVTVRVRSGEELKVHFNGAKGAWTNVRLEGSAHLLYTGTLCYSTDPPYIRMKA